MFDFIKKGVNWLNDKLNSEIDLDSNNLDILSREINNFLHSSERKAMIKACEYYDDKQDILNHEKFMIGERGERVAVDNVLNYKVLNNLYATHVDKKVSYLLGKEFTVKSDNEIYDDLLEDRFNQTLRNKLKLVCSDMVKCGVGYLHPYYKDNELRFRRFKPYEIKVFYKDDEKEEIDFFFRHYVEKIYTRGLVEEYAEFVDVYTQEEVKHYRYKNNRLTLIEDPGAYISINDKTFKWDKFPLLVFRYNEDEQILLNRVKSLQDGINLVTSNFQNGMLEDANNTILVVKNYDGADPREIRHNISTFRTIKIRDTEGTKGGVDTLNMEINSQNYELFLDIYKKALIKGMKSVDIDDLKSGTPNQMNIQAMFNDIDQDATSMENEIQKTLSDMIWFMNTDISLKNLGNFENEKVEIILNRDLMQDENSIIDNIVKLVGLVSDETLLAQIPFISDPSAESDRVKQQKKEDFNEYSMNFPNQSNKVVEDEE